MASGSHFVIQNYIVKKLRINLEIRVPTIRLIGAEGEQLGIMSRDAAIALAQEAGLDLAEVAPNVVPPVCKILDYGKYQYHQKKVEMKHRRMQKKAEMKGIRIGFKIGDHDLGIKSRQAHGFLEDGNPVKVTLLFRGREAAYKDLGLAKMMKFYEAVKDVGHMDEAPKKQGNAMLMVITPSRMSHQAPQE
ncbi:MAG: translation initiation factor IF-3 [Candidatus Peregrinibacteria bacterium]|nr:translation initiation factor IF-3 [Candidatus Peregrinibacteria bacterium]